MGHRFLRILVSMYFDDAHLTDLDSVGPSAQWAFGELNVMLGTPSATDKRQPFAPSCTFWGWTLTSVQYSPEVQLRDLLGSREGTHQNPRYHISSQGDKSFFPSARVQTVWAAQPFWKTACLGELVAVAFVQSRTTSMGELTRCQELS